MERTKALRREMERSAKKVAAKRNEKVTTAKKAEDRQKNYEKA